MSERRTQAERRAETQAAVLDSAAKLFGEKGYAKTSLEDIAGDCGISIAPIYHYFGNKKNLFQAVNQVMEARILAPENSTDDEFILSRWRGFLNLCKDAHFRQIVLVDGPAVLGLERMSESKTSAKMLERIEQRFAAHRSNSASGAAQLPSYKSELVGRMIVGALAEAGLFIGSAEDPEQACQDADDLVAGLMQMLDNFSDFAREKNDG